MRYTGSTGTCASNLARIGLGHADAEKVGGERDYANSPLEPSPVQGADENIAADQRSDTSTDERGKREKGIIGYSGWCSPNVGESTFNEY